MIPILYESTETAFVNNGLGRLRDCIECKVTEEQNGIYECDFSYPVDGAHFDLITIGRIIGVTHDESEDIQPFDIVSYSRPIDGVVEFHCTHISYRQSYLTTTGSNINSLADAFNLLRASTPTNPFTYWTDKTSSTGFMSAADGLPKSVRSLLGGIEGSILDAYGGEYEWDRFTVKLWSARGQLRNFSIRYGVNMLEYNEDYSIEGTYISCIPYWTDGTNTVIGDKQTGSGQTVTARDECIPMDVSDKFDVSGDTLPTKAQVEAMGKSLLDSQNAELPVQNITVKFARLQDLGMEEYVNLMSCNLCDTINVVFPSNNGQGTFKIVKTVWDVLADRYEEMELGQLSVTLSQALGVGSNTTYVSGGGGGGDEPEDYVIEKGTSGIWTYRKWNSGAYEAWYEGGINLGTGSAMGGGYFHTSSSGLTPPTFSISVTSLTGASNGAQLYAYVGHSATYQTYWWNGSSSANNSVPVRLDMYGTWK